jgi:hypothetical protein
MSDASKEMLQLLRPYADTITAFATVHSSWSFTFSLRMISLLRLVWEP